MNASFPSKGKFSKWIEPALRESPRLSVAKIVGQPVEKKLNYARNQIGKTRDVHVYTRESPRGSMNDGSSNKVGIIVEYRWSVQLAFCERLDSAGVSFH